MISKIILYRSLGKISRMSIFPNPHFGKFAFFLAFLKNENLKGPPWGYLYFIKKYNKKIDESAIEIFRIFQFFSASGPCGIVIVYQKMMFPTISNQFDDRDESAPTDGQSDRRHHHYGPG